MNLSKLLVHPCCLCILQLQKNKDKKNGGLLCLAQDIGIIFTSSSTAVNHRPLFLILQQKPFEHNPTSKYVICKIL